MTHVRQGSTTEMQVTSIRLEQELKEHLKALAGQQGYQALIREILWNYVEQHSSLQPDQSLPNQNLTPQSLTIRATLPATAQSTECCILTGQLIHPGESMLLGLTLEGRLVPLAAMALSAERLV
ncbi:MAG: ribbon-helix-helix domain-containing protein [Thermosynechococcaceae cyanobacterium MS004]|nr:ribbon-helix-helix domain-containing protein [Thermosynechococcaceae cyanobacterium MS004]